MKRTGIEIGRRRERAWTLALAALLFTGAATTTGAAMAPETQGDELPAGAAVLDRYVEATGGLEAYGKVRNRVTTSTIDVPAQGFRATITIYAAPPNKVYAVMESEAFGRIEQGCDGTVVWMNSAMTGPLVKDGKERASELRASVFDRMSRWREAFAKVDCVGVEDVEGKPCYKVLLTPNPLEGEPVAADAAPFFFDKESGLLVKYETGSDTPAGRIVMEAFPQDYRAVDGVRIAHKLVVKAPGQDRTITTEKIEQNVDLPADRFDLPAEIRAVLEREKGKEGEKD